MNISTASNNDIPQICNLLNLLFKQEKEFVIDEYAQHKGLTIIVENPQIGEILVARDGEKILASVNLLYTISTALGGKVALLEDMVVDEQFRGQGIGSSLIEYAIEHVKTKGVKRITLLTDGDNASAHKFYTKHGFCASSMIPFRLIVE